MSARHKLNHFHLTGDIVLAGIAGLLTQSWPLFFLALAVLVGLDLQAGQIRPRRTAHTDRPGAEHVFGSFEKRRGTMRRKSGNPLPALVGGTLVVAALCTVIVEGGWVLWLPAVLALAVTASIWNALTR